MSEGTRFWSKVDKTEDCWNWTAGKSDGYGIFGIGSSRTVKAHRYSYEQQVGPIPPGAILDHICRNRSCVNPEHLRPVDRVLNAQNHSGPTARNTSGVRGVCWEVNEGRWLAQVSHRGRIAYRKRFKDLREAEAAVIEARRQILTHNELDRAA